MIMEPIISESNNPASSNPTLKRSLKREERVGQKKFRKVQKETPRTAGEGNLKKSADGTLDWEKTGPSHSLEHSQASVEMKNMKKLIESKNNQIKALEERIGRFDEEMEELHEKQEKIVACLYAEKLLGEKKLLEAHGLIEQNRNKNKEILVLNAALAEKNGSLKRLEEKLNETELENVDLKKQLASIKTELEQKDKQASVWAEQISHLETKLSEYKGCKAQEKTSEDLQELCQGKESEVSKLTEEVYKKESQIVRLKVKNLKINSNLKKIKAAHKERETDLESLLDQTRQERDQNIESLQSQLADRKLELDQLIWDQKQLREEKNNLKWKNEEKDGKIESLIQQTFEKELEIKELLEQVIDKESTIESLRAEKSQLQAQNAVNDKKRWSEKEMRELRSVLGKKEEQINMLNASGRTQEKQIKDLQKYSSEKKDQAEKLKIENKEKLKEIATKDEYLRTLHAQFVEIDQDIQKIKKEYEEKERLVRELEATAKEREAELERLSLKIDKNENKYKTSLADLEKQVGLKERIVDDLQNLQAKKDKDIKRLINQNSEFEKEKKILKENFIKQNSDFEKENKSLKEILIDQKNELEKMNLKKSILEAEVTQLNTAVSAQKAEIDRLETIRAKADNLAVENISTQTEELQNYEIIAEQLHMELVKVKNELLEMNKSNRNLRKELILKGITELGTIGRL